MKRGILFVVSGPSGVGKGTILSEVFAGDPALNFSISATTRQPRPGEIDGVHYYFLDKDDFKAKIDNDEFLEWSQHYDQYYGTLRKPVFDKLDEGVDVVLDIEVNGVNTLLSKEVAAVYVFIAPPDIKELKNRLLKRNTETMEKVEKRIARAEWELSHSHKYNYIILNDDLFKAVYDLQSIINAERRRVR